MTINFFRGSTCNAASFSINFWPGRLSHFYFASKFKKDNEEPDCISISVVFIIIFVFDDSLGSGVCGAL